MGGGTGERHAPIRQCLQSWRALRSEISITSPTWPKATTMFEEAGDNAWASGAAHSCQINWLARISHGKPDVAARGHHPQVKRDCVAEKTPIFMASPS